jgi:hypothetical protein
MGVNMKRLGEYVFEFSEEDVVNAKIEGEERCRQRFDHDEKCTRILAFVPIQIELIQLFEHWYTQILTHRLYPYAGIYTGRKEDFEEWLSCLRCNQICTQLPEHEIQDAINRVHEAFKKGKHGGFTEEKDWDIFFSSTSHPAPGLPTLYSRER